MYCTNCGAKISDGGMFCGECGTRVITAQRHVPVAADAKPSAAQPAKTDTQPQRPVPVAADAKPSAAQPVKTVAPPQPRAPKGAASGLMDLGEIDPSVFCTVKAAGAAGKAGRTAGKTGIAAGNAVGAAEKVKSPVAGIFSGIGSWFGGIFGIFKKPLALIAVIGIGVLWVLLEGDLGDDVPFLSWLTFAQGGFDRELPGAVLGTIGKGVVGAVLISLFSGGLKNFFKGIGVLFVGHGEKRGFFGILFGIVVGGLIYFAFVGEEVSSETAMAGIAGAVLSLEALGGGKGRIYELARSLTSRSVDGVRTAMRGKCDGFLTGLTLGFGIMTVLSFAGVLEGML